MKKLYYLIVLTLILGLVLTGCFLSNVGQVPTSEQKYNENNPNPNVFESGDLVAGQNSKVGTVVVSNDGTDLTVTYNTTSGWVLTETHLAVADSLAGIPQTKKGNPIPGKFPYSAEHDPAVTEYTYTIPLDTHLYIAAHAEVEKRIDGGIIQEETAWGAGDRFVDKGNWGMYFEYVEPYSFTNTQPVDGGTLADLVTTVAEDGDWMVWTFDFPVEQFTGNGNLNVGLIIATDGEGNGPAFQIHNDDGADSAFVDGTWLYSEWGPAITDGWFGWHTGTGGNNELVSGIAWIEATGQRNTPWQGIVSGDGVMEIRIKKSELGDSFHWAASPTVGSGFFAPVYDVTMQIPTAFKWDEPVVNMTIPNYIVR